MWLYCLRSGGLYQPPLTSCGHIPEIVHMVIVNQCNIPPGYAHTLPHAMPSGSCIYSVTCVAGPKALKKFKRLMMNRIKWKPKKAAAGVCVCGVGVYVCVECAL